jgi:hypothetical protein
MVTGGFILGRLVFVILPNNPEIHVRFWQFSQCCKVAVSQGCDIVYVTGSFGNRVCSSYSTLVGKRSRWIVLINIGAANYRHYYTSPGKSAITSPDKGGKYDRQNYRGREVLRRHRPGDFTGERKKKIG